MLTQTMKPQNKTNNIKTVQNNHIQSPKIHNV